MTQYEIIRRTPTGLRVTIYLRGEELVTLNVPAVQCQTVAKLESFLRQIAAREITNVAVPPEVANLKGKRQL